MVFLGFSPYFIFSSFFTTLLLDRGIHVTGNKQFSTSSPWNPSPASSGPAKSSNDESEALKRVLPLVTFDCRGKTGYFPDSKFNCEVFHYCQPDGARNTFHCPTHKLFNQLSMVCEEKTVHNSRLCKEGSINPTKFQRNSASKKHDASQKTGPNSKPSLKGGNSGDIPKQIMTLEDLLSYMNSGQLGRESEPTFISRFHDADESKRTRKPSNSAITTPKPENKSTKDRKPSKSIDANLSAQGSDQSFSVAKSQSKFGANLKKNVEEEEDISIEYDAIEGGRKFRKHKRVGRVLDVPTVEQPKKEKENKPHAHMTERSATDTPFEESTTLLPPTESKNGNAPSLFSTDRNKARDFRKRKRYQGRKRKMTTPVASNETDTEFDSPTTTMNPTSQMVRQDPDTIRSNAYRRRKSQRPRVRDEALKGIHKSEKVEPYTLPPLPIPDEEKTETTTESMHREEKKKDSQKEGRAKNPWHKPTPPPTNDGVQYGVKLSDLDQHHYHTDVKMAEGPAPPAEYYGTKDIPHASEEMLGEEYRERLVSQSKNIDDVLSSHRSNIKNFKKYTDEDNYKYGSHPDKHHYAVPENLFPPPRAESREHHSTPPQQMINPHESGSEKSKDHNSFKATTEYPFRVTHPYPGKYQTGVQELKDMKEQQWKSEAEKAKSSEKKIEVGATFFFQNPVTSATTKKPRLQVPPTTEAPVTHSVSKERDIPKHTLAHQHLSKIMNDFFAMSSSNNPGRVHLDSTKEEDLIVPEYRIPDEDIYAGSESATEDVEEIPPELLEVVDLITGHVGNEKSNLKPRASHEIIKIDGPITESHIEKIFMDKFEEEESDRHQSADGSYKKIVVVPQPSEDKESRSSEEIAELTSLKLEPFLKQISDEKSLRMIPLKAEPIVKRQPALLTAKKIPVRVIYRDQLTEAVRSKLATRKPSVKLVRTHLTAPHMKLISSGKRPIFSPLSHSYTRTRTSLVLHPPSLYPPHPPPLPRKPIHFKIGYPFVTNSRSHMQNTQLHRRKKRSIMNRLRRQIRQNQHFLPFSSPVYPTFNPKFVPTFSPFKALFSPTSLRTSGTHLNPYIFPGFPLAKPSQNRPNVFQASHPRPPPVRHLTQSGHQAVIVEEVPVPIHVEVPNPNLIRPLPSGAHPPKLNARYPGNQFRAPSPPAIQTPPLLQRPQHRFPPPPLPPHSSNYRPLGMPANARPPPPMNYRSPLPLTGPLPPSITSEGQVYALGVTNKPIIPEKPRPPRPPNGGPNHPRNPPRPYNPFSVHASAYPNFPYFQGAFTTPISNEPVVGRLMYSGYKPPKSTLGTKPPKSSTRSNKDRKASESKSNRSRSKATSDYFEAPAKPLRESHVSYTEEVIPRGRSRPKPNLDDYSVDHTELKPPKQSLSKNSGSSDEFVPRKRRPGRRRRPRPHSTTQGTPILNDISPTPPPPEQIPPPPADYTSKPSHHETLSSLPSFNAGTKIPETSSHFPPAGYYGKDQLVQFFDSSSKSYQKTTSPKPYHPRDLGESTSSAELDESVTSISGEDGNEPAFGTRLRSKPHSQSRNRQLKSNNQPARSQTQKTEVRTRPNNRPDEISEQKRKEFTRPNENNKMPIRNDRPLPRRRRPPQPRPRSRPPQMPAPQPEIHHFKYNENVGNFYSVPRGLQNLVAPSAHPQQGFRGSTDMFGLPHPVIDQSIYSLRPQGAPDFDPNFFSVPAHVSQQQQSPLRNMNIKPIPESSRDFFTAPESGSATTPEASAPEKKESEHRTPSNKSGGESNEQRDPPVRKLRKPKRKNRYNPHSSEQRDSAEAISVKPYTEQMTTRDSSTVRYREKSTTIPTTTAEPRSTLINYQSQNDIRETPVVFKQRTPLLPKTLPELSKSLLNGKIDIQKLNATISTSVSVSGGVPHTNNSSSEEKDNKRVFSSQNGGGLTVVRKGPKRKRARQRVSTTTGVPYVNNYESSTDAKYEIAASVLDIIKATTETERQASGQYGNYYESNKSEKPSSSRVSNTWVESPSNKKQM